MSSYLFLCDYDEFDNSDLEALKTRLNPEQKYKLSALKNKRLNEFIVSRSLLNFALKQVLQLDCPTIVELPQKAPHIQAISRLNCSFSVSHSKSLIGVLITKNSVQTGLDIELIPNNYNIEKNHFFCNEQQLKAIQSLPAKLQASESIKLWTIKEAYFKSLGTGVFDSDLKDLSVTNASEDLPSFKSVLYPTPNAEFHISAFSTMLKEVSVYEASLLNSELSHKEVQLEWENLSLMTLSG